MIEDVDQAVRAALPDGWSITREDTTVPFPTKVGEIYWSLTSPRHPNGGHESYSVVLTRHRDRLLVSSGNHDCGPPAWDHVARRVCVVDLKARSFFSLRELLARMLEADALSPDRLGTEWD